MPQSREIACNICGRTFSSSTVNRYGPQKMCGSAECRREYTKSRYKKYAEYHRRYDEKRKALRRESRVLNGKSTYISSKPSPDWTVCYSCISYYKVIFAICPVCKTPQDQDKNRKAAERLKMPYMAHVRATAAKTGRDPKQAVRMAKLARRRVFIGTESNEAVEKKLDEYLEKKKTA